MTPPGPDTLFVVSGGGRGVTARCVTELARRFRSRFLLLGRTEVDEPEPAWSAGLDGPQELRSAALTALNGSGDRPTPVAVERMVATIAARREVLATLDAVRAAGGRARYLQVDITDAAAVRRDLPPALADVDELALLHGAGVLADRPIGRKTAADLDLVLGPKVRGLVNLLTCLPEPRLRHIVLFSSAAGFFGNPGQSDYAIANEVLNKAALLLRRRRPECRVVSMNWGPWDGGMVTDRLKAMFAERDIELIEPAAGAAVLADELAREPVGVELVVGRAPAGRTSPTPQPGGRRVRRVLDPGANPFLRDHLVDGRPVLPAAASSSWLVNAGEELLPGHRVVAARDYRVYNGIVFDDGSPVELTLELTPQPSSGGDVVLDARIVSQAPGGPRPRYGARLTLSPDVPTPPRVEVDPLPTGGSDGDALYRDGTLFHGPAFRGVRRVLGHDADHVWLECLLASVPARTQGQFPVRNFNHFAADVGFQAMLVWVRLQTGMASLPLSCAGCEIYAPLPFDRVFYARADVRRHDGSSLLADVTLHDREGVCYLRLVGAEVTISARLTQRRDSVAACS